MNSFGWPPHQGTLRDTTYKYTGLKVLSYSSYLVMESGHLPDSIFLEVRGILKPCEPLKGQVLWAIFFKNPQILEKNLRSTSQVGSYYPKQKFQELAITIPSKWLDNLPNAVFMCPPFLLNSTYSIVQQRGGRNQNTVNSKSPSKQ